MNTDEMQNSSDELSEKLRRVIEDHFGNLPGEGEDFQKSVDDVYILGSVMTEIMAKTAFIFGGNAVESAPEGAETDLEIEVNKVLCLYEQLLENSLGDIESFLSGHAPRNTMMN